eukprot:EG_transcript_59784
MFMAHFRLLHVRSGAPELLQNLFTAHGNTSFGKLRICCAPRRLTVTHTQLYQSLHIRFCCLYHLWAAGNDFSKGKRKPASCRGRKQDSASSLTRLISASFWILCEVF